MKTLVQVGLLALIACASACSCPAGRAQDGSAPTGTILPLVAPSRFVAARTVQIYLPPGYDLPLSRRQRYPVLYLQDGQNLFDGKTAFIKGHEWQADETANRLIGAGEVEPLIIVAVPNAGVGRKDEYTPSPDPKYGGGNAGQYEKFLIEELKPLVDRTFRTRRGAKDTGIGGSSLGALVSLDAGLRYPKVFQRIAALSPSVWWGDRAILTQVAATKRPPLRIYLDVGSREPGTTVPDARLLRDVLLSRGWTAGDNLMYAEGDGDAHNEDAWARRFPDVLRFLFPAEKAR